MKEPKMYHFGILFILLVWYDLTDLSVCEKRKIYRLQVLYPFLHISTCRRVEFWPSFSVYCQGPDPLWFSIRFSSYRHFWIFKCALYTDQEWVTLVLAHILHIRFPPFYFEIFQTCITFERTVWRMPMHLLSRFVTR